MFPATLTIALLATATQKKLAEAQNRLARANSTVRDYEMADSDGVLQAIEGIRTNLGTQLEQLRVFPDLTQKVASVLFLLRDSQHDLSSKLTAEVNEYQAALQNIRQDPSAVSPTEDEVLRV
ncbi:hypothetical protein C8Q77DRAFT_1104225 [Trametes polyzona]|nr:hypothetical protein C8Q77DRAFT_1104225 [Trametes polyzona]